jgi:hypothetical protein
MSKEKSSVSAGPAAAPISAAAMTHAQFAHLLSLYPAVVRRVYAARIVKHADTTPTEKEDKRLADALDDDAWRYGGLVQLVRRRRRTEGEEEEKEGGGAGGSGAGGGWLEKAELERLVRWKM